MQRFTLSYACSDGRTITIHNLLPAGCADIERAQTHLGSHGFTRTPQPHEYAQWELDALRQTGR
jgi:hypothetical protein